MKKSINEVHLGDVFATAKIIGKIYNAKRKEFEYNCLCLKCGNIYTVRKYNLPNIKNGCIKCSNKKILNT
jgi:hypothetical protein